MENPEPLLVRDFFVFNSERIKLSYHHIGKRARRIVSGSSKCHTPQFGDQDLKVEIGLLDIAIEALFIVVADGDTHFIVQEYSPFGKSLDMFEIDNI